MRYGESVWWAAFERGESAIVCHWCRGVGTRMSCISTDFTCGSHFNLDVIWRVAERWPSAAVDRGGKACWSCAWADDGHFIMRLVPGVVRVIWEPVHV